MRPHWCAHERLFNCHCLWPEMRRTRLRRAALARSCHVRGASQPADLAGVCRRLSSCRQTDDELEGQKRIERLRRSHIGYLHDLISIGPSRCVRVRRSSLLELAPSLKDHGSSTKVVAVCICPRAARPGSDSTWYDAASSDGRFRVGLPPALAALPVVSISW
jgi:hypothetical protein